MSTLWVCAACSTKPVSLNLSRSSPCGVRSVYLVLGLSSQLMTGSHHIFVHGSDGHHHLPRCSGRVGTTVCRWLFQTVHDTSAISVFDYILPLMVSCLDLVILPAETDSVSYLSPNFSASPKVRPQYHFYLRFIFSPRNIVVNDNNELVNRARTLLVRMCGVTPPRPLIGPILKAIFSAIQNSPVRPHVVIHIGAAC